MELKKIPMIAIDSPTRTETALKISFSSRPDSFTGSINKVRTVANKNMPKKVNIFRLVVI